MSESLKPSDTTKKEMKGDKKQEDCDICGEDHETESCPLLGGGLRIDDAVAPPRARLTIPSNLRAKTLKDGTVTIVARENIPANTRFGPFEAPRRTAATEKISFPLKVFNNDEDDDFYLDTTQEDVCNWMCLVLPAESQREQNLMAFQLLQEIFFSSKRDIRIHEELKVWYAPHYGKKMGAEPLVQLATCENTKQQLNEELDVIEKEEPSVKDALLPKKRERKRKIFEETVKIQEDAEDAVVSENSSYSGIDPKRLGFETQRDWRCSQCTEVYSNCIDFARHLRDHYKPRKTIGENKKKGTVMTARLKTFECQFCPLKFSSKKLLQKHGRRLHRRQLRSNKMEDANKVEGIKGEEGEEDEDEPKKCMSKNDAATILLEIEAKCDATEEVEQPENDQRDAVTTETIASDDDGANTDVIMQCDVTCYDDILVEGKELEPTEVVLEDIVQNTELTIIVEEETDTKLTLDDGEATTDSKDVALVVEALTEQTEKQDREFVCDICSKSFDKSIYLFRHIRKHTGEFACSKCQKVFARKESLLKHTCIDPNADDVDESVQKTFLCSYCHKSFDSRHLLKRHVAKHTGDFTCDKCGKSYCSRDVLGNHVCSKNPNPGKFSCDICHKTFTKLKYVKKHIPVHTGAHTCPICGKWLRSHDSVVNHMRICGQVKELEVTGLAPCPHCKKQFTDLQSFRRHLYEHTHVFACDSCGARFRNKVNLATHYCDAMGDGDMVCETCGKTFRNSSSLKRHSLTHEDKTIVKNDSEGGIEGEECETEAPNEDGKSESLETPPKKKPRKQPSLQPLICEVCGSLFSSTSSLNVHKRLHGEKLFSCEMCGKQFHRKDLMLDHYAVHGEPVIPCAVCFKMFKTKKSLDVHLLIHDGVKRFTCATCGKQFYQKGNLIKHEYVHKPEHKHHCNICAKAFSTKEYLTIHILEHTRGRIFGCSQCDKSFVKEHQLKAHQRIFHTDLMYACKFCGIHVKLKHSLKRHLNKKHSDQQHLWSSGNEIDEMLVTKETLATADDRDLSTENETAETTVKGGEVLLAVTRIRTDELQQAIASGSAQAHFQQGSVQSTIEISLPMNQSLKDAIMVETGEQLETHIIQLPLATEEVNDTEVNVKDGEESENQIEIDQTSMDEEGGGEEAHITVVDNFPQDGTLPEGTLVLENGTILQQGVTEDGSDVLFYVFTSDEQECNKTLAGEEET